MMFWIVFFCVFLDWLSWWFCMLYAYSHVHVDASTVKSCRFLVTFGRTNLPTFSMRSRSWMSGPTFVLVHCFYCWLGECSYQNKLKPDPVLRHADSITGCRSSFPFLRPVCIHRDFMKCPLASLDFLPSLSSAACIPTYPDSIQLVKMSCWVVLCCCLRRWLILLVQRHLVLKPVIAACRFCTVYLSIWFHKDHHYKQYRSSLVSGFLLFPGPSGDTWRYMMATLLFTSLAINLQYQSTHTHTHVRNPYRSISKI